jgi:shikimate dehydrogenase
MKRACVIGWPVEHSRSPAIHSFWLKAYGINGAYKKEAVPPAEASSFIRSLGERGYVGANVTLPHKIVALEVAERADEAARAIGAANTLWLDDGKLHASNSDASGFLANLDETAPGWDEGRRPAVVLGAGGAARAIVYALRERGVPQIQVANRSRDKADGLAQAFGPGVEALDWDERFDALAGAGLLVNATSLGMTAQPALDIDLGALPKDAVVTDIIYAPLETALLAAARARGNRVVDGLGMLLHQAVPGFEHWFGVKPEVTAELRRHVAASLGEA